MLPIVVSEPRNKLKQSLGAKRHLSLNQKLRCRSPIVQPHGVPIGKDHIVQSFESKPCQFTGRL